jgi:hypothetical protein
MPASAAGSRPTALTEVRPPTQSHIGNRASHPPATASRSSCDPSEVMATIRGPTSSPCASASRPGQRSSALAVSGVPPDLTRPPRAWCAGPPPQAARCRPDRCCRRSAAAARRPSASASTSDMRAQRRAADADVQHVGERLPSGVGDAALTDVLGEGRERPSTVAPMPRAMSIDGASCRRAEPVMADLAALVDVGHGPLLDRRHRGEGARPGQRVDVRRREPHRGGVERGEVVGGGAGASGTGGGRATRLLRAADGNAVGGGHTRGPNTWPSRVQFTVGRGVRSGCRRIG